MCILFIELLAVINGEFAVPSPQFIIKLGVSPPKSINGVVNTVLAVVVVILNTKGKTADESDSTNLLNIPITIIINLNFYLLRIRNMLYHH